MCADAVNIPIEGYRAMVEQCSSGIVVQSDKHVVYANRAALDCLGYGDGSELLGRPLNELFDLESLSTLLPNLRKLGPDDDQLFIGDLRLLTRSRTTIDAEVYHSAIEFGGGRATMINFRDVTQTKRLEHELRQAQKLESIGRLAAGVAHEINTPIQYVGNNAHYLNDMVSDVLGLLDRSRAELREWRTQRDGERALEELAAEEEQVDLDYMRREGPRSVAAILEGVSRVARIVAAMKSFSHPGSEHATPMNVNQMVEDTLVVASYELKNTATVTTELAELPPVSGYPADLNQALLNLVVNAAHAIADRREAAEPGTIRISTRTEDGHVAISVADNGCGMPAHVQARLFEPFFTTKEVGRGTGQGLVLARAVAHKHGGTIDFESAVGRGTTFVLRLPLDLQT